MKKMVSLLILLFLLFFLLGCTEMSREEKNLCYSLTSRSYSFIPNCETEESCFTKVDSLFNTNFNLGNEQDSQIYSLKNYFARSWFFYNKGIKEMKNISKSCQNADASKLPGQINQARFYFNEAFTLADEGLKKSIEIIALEENYLSEEKIDLIKEEDIFENLTELRQILADLDSENTKSNNYLSFYLDKINNFNSSNAINSTTLIEKDSFWIKTYNYVSGTILEEIGMSKKITVPILGNYFSQMFDSIENIFYAYESIIELKKIPTHEFIILYSNLAGNQNSSLKMFINLINKTSKSTNIVKNSINTYWTQTKSNKIKAKQILEEINEFDKYSNLINKLYSGEMTSDLSLNEKFTQTESDLFTLTQEKNQYKIKIGEELNKLKTINISFLEIINTANKYKISNISLLSTKCKSKANEIKKQKYYPQNDELIKIQEELIYFTEKTIKETDETQFYFCEKMLNYEEELNLGINNYEQLLLNKTENTKECFAFLEKIFVNFKNYELKQAFDELKAEIVTKENLLYFNQACENIKNQTMIELKEDLYFKKIQKEITLLFKTKDKLKTATNFVTDLEINKKIEEINKKLLNWNKYFDEKEIFYENLIIIKTDFLALITEYNQNNNLFWEKKHIELLEKMIIKKAITNEHISINTPNQIIEEIIIDNPFEEINKTTKIRINLDTGELYEAINEIENIVFGKEGFVVFNKIRLGKTTFKIKKNLEINTIENEKIIYATNRDSLILRTIKLDVDNINQITIMTKKPINYSKLVLMINQQEVLFSIKQNNIEFVASNINKNSDISLFIYRQNLITLEKKLINITQLDLFKRKVIYEIIAKNNFNEKLSATLIIPHNEITLKLNIYDEIKTNKQKQIENNQILLKNQEFLALQERKYELVLEVDDILEYYITELERLNEELITLNSQNKPLLDEIKSILDIPFNEDLIKKYEDLINQANKEINKIKIEIEEQIKENLLDQKIIDLKDEIINQINEANSLGLFSVASELNGLLTQINNSNLTNEEIISLISSQNFDIDLEITNELEKIWNYLKDLDYDQIEIQKQEIFDKMTQINQIIAFDPINAKKKFIEIQKIYSEIKEIILQKEEELKNKETTTQKEIEKYVLLSRELINILKKELNYDLKDYIKLKIIFPITKERLAKIELEIENISSESFDDLIKIKDYYFELKTALSEIKKETINKYNLAIDAGQNAFVLGKAKAFIDKNEYVNALFALNQTDQTNVLIGIIPIFALIVASVILKVKFSKGKKNKQTKKEKIIKQWEEEY